MPTRTNALELHLTLSPTLALPSRRKQKVHLTWVLPTKSSLSAAGSSILIAMWPSTGASFPRLYPLLFLCIFKHLASSAESAKKDLEDIAKKTWQNIITIISKDLKKDQTPDQAFDELIATGRLSKEALQVQSNFRLNIGRAS